MNNEARKMWQQPAGLELFKRMLEGGPHLRAQTIKQRHLLVDRVNVDI